MSLAGKTVLLGVTGGIAAYKAVEVVSRLRKQGAAVRVIMTKNATEFVTPLTFETLANHPVVTDTFARPETWDVAHVSLAKEADLCVVAPATANLMAKLAVGLADDMLSTTLLATKAPLLLAPAMNTGMWTAEVTQRNAAILKQRGVHFVGPEGGFLACGDTGAGRMSEPAEIVAAIEALLSRRESLGGVKVLVTAGATREHLDPVRFLTNESSGKMGFALAEAARDRGAEVTLVKGWTTASVPTGVKLVEVSSTQELYDAVTGLAPEMNAVVQAAAPADYRFQNTSSQKIKKKAGEPLTFTLEETPDIAAAVGRAKKPGQVLVGFAAETEQLIEHAQKKLRSKNLDFIVANDVTQPGAGFNVDTNIAAILSEDGARQLPMMSKRQLAEEIWNEVEKRLSAKQ